MEQFSDEETSRILFLDLSRIRINEKEKVKYFNQVSITLLNMIFVKLIKEVQIEFYIAALSPPISMFVKNQ